MQATNPRETIIDKMLIQDTVERYTLFLNSRDWEAFGRLLLPDFLFDCSEPIVTHCEGRKAMLHMLSGAANYRHGFVFQMPHGMIVDHLANGRARARHTLHVKATSMNVLGIYYDALALQDDGVWRFARRDFRITYHDPGLPPGKLYRSFPDPGQPAWYFDFNS